MQGRLTDAHASFNMWKNKVHNILCDYQRANTQTMCSGTLNKEPRGFAAFVKFLHFLSNNSNSCCCHNLPASNLVPLSIFPHSSFCLAQGSAVVGWTEVLSAKCALSVTVQVAWEGNRIKLPNGAVKGYFHPCLFLWAHAPNIDLAQVTLMKHVPVFAGLNLFMQSPHPHAAKATCNILTSRPNSSLSPSVIPIYSSLWFLVFLRGHGVKAIIMRVKVKFLKKNLQGVR